MQRKNTLYLLTVLVLLVSLVPVSALAQEKGPDNFGSRGGVPDSTPPIAYTSPADFSESFDDVTLLLGMGWYFQNNSAPLGVLDGWYQGSETVFPAQAGAPTAYIAANYNATAGVGTISDWMLTPEISLANGDTISFWTRTATGSIYPDRLQVRLSTAGASTNVGTLATDVGDFTTLLLDINPTLAVGGYPETWTQYTATLSGIPGSATGRIAWRYFVTDGGPSGNNSNYIGVDTVEYVSNAAGPSISLAKTVGTTAGVCANTSAITVTPGTTVYYCYTVTNTGDTTLDIHSLTDDVLGTIFTDLNYSLTPGSSVNTVQAGLSISYVANATTTNVGTWTASNQAGAQAEATATATVTVQQPSNRVCNTAPISIPDSGAATPYPSTIMVSGQATSLTDVTVELLGMNHTFPDDIDVLLVGPQGQNLIIMSDAGSSFDLVNVDLTFDDAAAGPLPDAAQIVSGSYQPTNYGTGDTFPAPAPAPSAATQLATFNGTDPNGTWSLYVVDDLIGDLGSIAGGWCLNISAAGGQNPPNIDVNPLSLSATQAPNTTTQQQVTIANTGEADLVWSISEEPTAPRPAMPPSSGPAKLGAPTAVERSAKELQDLLESPTADVVQDGSFEAGTPNPFWTEASTNFGTPLCTVAGCGAGTGTGPLTGAWWAWFGGIDTYEAGSVSQSVTIPSGGPATLTFWVEQFVCSGDAADYLEVNMDGTQLWVTTGTDPACGVFGYRQVTLDVSAYANGSSHTLEFNSEITGNGGGTNFFVDDVALDAQGGSGGPCVNPADVPWLSEVPANGTTAGGASTPVQVTFDSTGVAPGTYNANLCVDSNDPDPGPGNGTDLVIVPVTLTVQISGTPNIDVSPLSLNAAQDPNTTTQQTLNVGNTGGADLTWQIDEEPASAPKRAVPEQGAAPKLDLGAARKAGNVVAQLGGSPSPRPMTAPAPLIGLAAEDPDSLVSLVVDDGSYEDSIGLTNQVTSNAAVWLNRFTPTGDYPFQLEQIQILWPDAASSLINLVGQSVTLLVYTDTDGDGNPANATLVYQQTATIAVQGTGFDVYNLTTPVTLNGPGDVIIGFRDDWNLGGQTAANFPAAIDQTASAQRSWVAGNGTNGVDPDINNLGNNEIVGIIDDFGLPGNWTIRGYGNTSGQAECTNLADVPWLSVNPTSGSTPGGGSTPVTVSFDSTGLTPGTYNANLCISSNDPDPGPGNGTELVVVPVELVVNQGGNPAIELNKTVGTTPGVCAATDNIVVTAGTEVYYCYQVTNTGDVTLNFHDLEDSELGTILDNFPYTLAPGASSPQVIVPATPMATVTNTGTWTAYDAIGGYSVGPANYNWQGISGTGTSVPLTDDSMSGAIPIGFPFTYYGTSYTDLYISSNGFLTVLPGQYNGCCSGQPMPTPGDPDGVIAGWWDDLNPSAGGMVYYETLGTAPNRIFIVEFSAVPHYPSGNNVSMEFKFYEGSNNIEVHYETAPNDGSQHSAGIENQDGTVGVQYYLGSDPLPVRSAVRYTPVQAVMASDTDTATVTVLVPNIDVNPLSLSSTQLPDTVVNVPMSIANTGQGNLMWEITEVEPSAPPAGRPAGPSTFQRPVITSAKDCGPYLQPHVGPVPEGFLEYCAPANRKPVEVAGDGKAPTDNAYSLELVNGTFFSFPLNNFTAQHVIGNQSRAIFAMDFDADATTLYAIDYDTNDFGTLDLNTGAFTVLGTSTPSAGQSWTGLTIDPLTNEAYASSCDITSSVIYSVNLTNGAVTPIGTTTDAPCLIDISISPNGDMYGHDIVNNAIYRVSRTTGAVTYVGLTGYDANYAQGMDFDNDDGTLYIFLFDFTSFGTVYGTVDLNTGAVTPLAFTQDLEYEGAVQNTSFCAALDAPWLSLSPTAGTTPGGTSTPVNATFDSTGLAVGTYTANLCVRSNDPDNGPGNGTKLVIVPVTLIVQGQPSITVNKTVGVTPGVCAVTSNITVPAGTTVYYCYTVTNTGDVTLNSHDLVDDKLGTIFTNFTYALTPGASVNTVQAGLSIPAIMTMPTTNVATWTARQSSTGGLTATATATAFVDVTYLNCNDDGEDFDSVPPLGWTVVSSLPNGPQWTTIAACGEAGNYASGNGGAACASSGQFGNAAFDTQLRSPVFSLAGYTDVDLNFQLNYQNWAGIDKLDVDISTDGGATWSLVRRYTSDMGAFQSLPGVNINLDLSPWGGNANVMLRWRYYSGAVVTAWYAQVDEVKLKCNAPPTAVTLSGLEANNSAPMAAAPVAALPAAAGLALAAAAWLRRKR